MFLTSPSVNAVAPRHNLYEKRFH